jgi:hypothetical protein
MAPLRPPPQLRSLLAGLFLLGAPSALAASAYTSVEAERFTSQRGTQDVTLGATTAVGHFGKGDFLRYASLDFGTASADLLRLRVSVAPAHAGRYIEIRLDSPTGPLVGELQVRSTTGWDVFQEQTTSITHVTGVHDVYLVARGNGDVANVDALRFERGATSLTYQEKLFPAGGKVVDVRSFGAVGDGEHDDTDALQRAITQTLRGGSTVLYLPNGTYLVSRPLEWKDKNGNWNNYLTLQGQDRERTTIRLVDAAPGFGASDTPKAVLHTASQNPSDPDTGAGNSGFSNHIRDLTIDTGVGNPKAIGIDYIANNYCSIRDVTVRSSDPARVGVAGVSLTRYAAGPCLFKNLEVQGFDVGVRTDKLDYGSTWEHLVLREQRVAGIHNTKNLLAIRGLRSHNRVPAILNEVEHGLVTLIDSTLDGGAATAVAIENTDGEVFLRNVKATGYKAAIRNKGTDVPGLTVTEYTSSAPIRLSAPATQRSLALPIEETPELNDPPSLWVDVKGFGAKGDGKANDTEAIRRALQSEASTVYFPPGNYVITGELVPGPRVKRILGFFAWLHLQNAGDLKWTPENADDRPTEAEMKPVFHFTGTANDLFIEGLTVNSKAPAAVFIQHGSPRTLTLKDLRLGVMGPSESGPELAYRNTATGTGKLFIEDVVGARWHINFPQKVWARQLNTEINDVHVRNRGGQLWALGLKTEGSGTVVHTSAGGASEVIGGFLYPAVTVPQTDVAFVSVGARQSLSFVETSYVKPGSSGKSYTHYVQEARSGATQSVQRDRVIHRGHGALVHLFLGQ